MRHLATTPYTRRPAGLQSLPPTQPKVPEALKGAHILSHYGAQPSRQAQLQPLSPQGVGQLQPGPDSFPHLLPHCLANTPTPTPTPTTVACSRPLALSAPPLASPAAVPPGQQYRGTDPPSGQRSPHASCSLRARSCWTLLSPSTPPKDQHKARGDFSQPQASVQGHTHL